MSKLWCLTWNQKREWDLGDVEVKPCKKKEEFYEKELPSILYKSPYKYHLRINGNVNSTEIFTTFKLVYSDSGDTLNSKSFDVSDKKATVHQTSCSPKPVLEKMVSFSICSYKHGGRSFKLSLSIFDEKGIVCTYLSPSFVVKAKKPIANPGIKSNRNRNRKRKHSKITKSPNRSKRKKSPNTKPKKKRRKNSYRPKPNDNRKITLREETVRLMNAPTKTSSSFMDSPLTSDEDKGKSFSTNQQVVGPPEWKKFNVRLETQKIIEREGEKYHDAYTHSFPLTPKKKKKKKKNKDPNVGLMGGNPVFLGGGGGGGGDYYYSQQQMMMMMLMNDSSSEDDDDSEDEDDDDDSLDFGMNKSSSSGGDFIGEPTSYPSYPTYQETVSTTTISLPGYQAFPQHFQMHHQQLTAPIAYPTYGYTPSYTMNQMYYIPQQQQQQVIIPPPPPQPQLQQQQQQQQQIKMTNYNNNNSYKIKEKQQYQQQNKNDANYKNSKKKKTFANDELVSLLDPHNDIDITDYQMFDGFGPIKDMEKEQYINNTY